MSLSSQGGGPRCAGRRHGLTGQAARCEAEPGEAAPRRRAAAQRRRFSRAGTPSSLRALCVCLWHTHRVQGGGGCRGAVNVQHRTSAGAAASALTPHRRALLATPKCFLKSYAPYIKVCSMHLSEPDQRFRFTGCDLSCAADQRHFIGRA